MLGGLLSAAVPTGGDGDSQGSMEKRTIGNGPDSYEYQVYVPGKLQGERSLPLIVFLHGIGQRGTGGFVPTTGAAGALVRRYLGQVPAVVLLPQCRPGKFWTDPAMDRMVIDALERTVDEFGADPHRLYLTGVSMGGYGVWHLVSQRPEKFAALVSICGGSPLQSGDRFSPIARKVGATPAWVFHGSDDQVVPASESRRMVEAIKANRGKVKYNEYPGVGHNVWLQVLGEKELMPWLLTQTLG
jgi:predicted peptidase